MTVHLIVSCQLNALSPKRSMSKGKKSAVMPSTEVMARNNFSFTYCS